MTDEFKREYCRLVFDQVCKPGTNTIKYWWVGRSKTRAFTGYNNVSTQTTFKKGYTEAQFEEIFKLGETAIADAVNRIIIVSPPRCGKTLAMAAFKQFCEYRYRDGLLKTEEAVIKLKSEE